MSKGEGRVKKEAYFTKLQNLLTSYQSILLVQCDNVGSNQLQKIRIALRGEAVIMMGKNTMIRKCVRDMLEEHEDFEKLMPYIKGNIGFVFTNKDLAHVRDSVVSHRVKAPAKAGVLAQVDVTVPAGNTGFEPGKTSFFQALGIPTKITKGTIEIVNDVHLIKAGTRVGPSEAALLNMMNISPFTYGLTVIAVYDNGAVFEPSILDVKEENLLESLSKGIQRIAALSMAINYPTVASVPHMVLQGYKNLLSIALVTDIAMEAKDRINEMLADPSKFVQQTVVQEQQTKKEVVQEEEEEEEEEVDFGLFD